MNKRTVGTIYRCCKKCGQTRKLEEFQVTHTNALGVLVHRKTCIECRREIERLRHRKRNNQQLFGIGSKNANYVWSFNDQREIFLRIGK